MEMPEVVVKAVKDRAKEQDGRLILPCTEAFKLASEHSVEVGTIGQICNSNQIKIARCQLGCFK